MNIRKFFVKSFVLVSAMSALLTTGISAYAKDVSWEYKATNFYDYTDTYNGDGSEMYCATNGTSLTSKKSSYDGAYKWVRFSILGKSNNSYYTIDSREATGTTSSVSTESLPMTSAVARRIHKAQLYETSDINSGVIDNFDVRINKN